VAILFVVVAVVVAVTAEQLKVASTEAVFSAGITSISIKSLIKSQVEDASALTLADGIKAPNTKTVAIIKVTITPREKYFFIKLIIRLINTLNL
jgi:hypothetical protein